MSLLGAACIGKALRCFGRSRSWSVWPIVLLFISFTTSSVAAEPGKVRIFTSYPKPVYEPFQKAFEAQNPQWQLDVVRLKTEAGVKRIQKEAAKGESADLFWASAKDAFEILESDGLLLTYRSPFMGKVDHVGKQPIHDPEGVYTGVALAGYGMMWNRHFVHLHGLTPPQDWRDLTHAKYYGFLGMATPANSGTTHLAVESILQNYGWEEGWHLLKQMAGNVRAFADSSDKVPEGIITGQYGAGMVIDFFGLSNQSMGLAVAFAYPGKPSLVPASIGIIKNAPHAEGARLFIDFLLSMVGQRLLLKPELSRLPVDPAIYDEAPPGFPNPFKDSRLAETVPFDTDISKNRYDLLNHLFQATLIDELPSLQMAMTAIHQAEAALAQPRRITTSWFSVAIPFTQHACTGQAAQWLQQARLQLKGMPLDEQQSKDPALSKLFKGSGNKEKGKTDSEWQQQMRKWRQHSAERSLKATELAQQVLSSCSNSTSAP